MPILGEVELAYRTMTAEFVAITGTNGKTTTTALTGALLGESGRPVLVGGNIGRPLAAEALAFPAEGWVVAEVSSFQLETTDAFRPRVAAVLNVTPDHLDRHGSLAAYAEAKARIFRRPGPRGLGRAERRRSRRGRAGARRPGAAPLVQPAGSRSPRGRGSGKDG